MPLTLTNPPPQGCESIVGEPAMQFVAHLATTFGKRIEELLAERDVRHASWDGGKPLDFLEETRSVREADWTVAKVPADLEDRRVEITGPVDRKMVINALSCGASCYM